MENQVKFYLFLIAIIVAVAGCDKTDTGSVKDEIVYQEINQEYVLIRDVSLLRQKTDPVSSYFKGTNKHRVYFVWTAENQVR